MHKQLDVWNLAMEFVTDIYRMTKQFPADERFGMIDQMRRAAVSIPSNIAEGASRQTEKEFVQFLYIALGSAAEAETQMLIAVSLDYLKAIDTEYAKLQSIKRMLKALIKSKRLKHESNY